MPNREDSTTAGVKVLYSRMLAQRPMVRINGNVHYLSSGTSMVQTGGKVVSLFENTWMRACGVGSLQANGSRKINKMGNIELIRDVDTERGAFDSAVIATIRTAIPKFGIQSLNSFYEELMEITGEDDSMVRRGVSSSLGKIAPEDLLLSGALSHDSPFFTRTTVGKAIRQKGIENYGSIEIRQDLDLTGKTFIVEYPTESDPDFNNLSNEHLPNNNLSSAISSSESLVRSSSPMSTFSEGINTGNICFRILCEIISTVVGAVLLGIGFGVLNVATAGTAVGFALAIAGGIAFFGGGISLAVDCCKNHAPGFTQQNPNLL